MFAPFGSRVQEGRIAAVDFVYRRIIEHSLCHADNVIHRMSFYGNTQHAHGKVVEHFYERLRAEYVVVHAAVFEILQAPGTKLLL